MRTTKLTAAFLGLALLALPAWAQAPALTNGQYTTDNGRYTVSIELTGTTLVVIEPNKRSEYQRAADGTYQTVAANGIRYGIRILDARTVEAFKPEVPNSRPTRLTLSGAVPARPLNADAARNQERFEHYAAKARTDKDNAQVWTACGAAALARGTMNARGYREYAREVAQTLKPIMVQPATTPCADVIPQGLWR